jgi:hypothetical protein
MNKSLAILLVLAVFAFLSLGGTTASAQAPDGAPHERVQQQRAPAACPPDIQWGCVLSGSASPGLTLNSTSTANNATALYATLSNPGTGSAAVWGRVLGAATTRGYGVYGSHQGSGYGVFGNSNTGIGFYGYSNTNTGMQGQTNSTGANPGVLGVHAASSGTGAGVEGRTNSLGDDAVGVLGVVSPDTPGANSTAVRGINNNSPLDNTTTYGVWGTNSAAGAGVYGDSYKGAGVHGFSSNSYGVFGSSTGLSGAGVHGFSANGYGVFGSSTGNIGVYGHSDTSRGVSGSSTSGYGVSGSSTESVGVYGTSNSHYGVHGYSSADVGVFGESDTWVGVSGYSESSYGVYGQSVSSYAGWFVGKVRVNGNLEVTGSIGQPAGTTRVDHPLDPENQYLSHAFVESPEMMTVYNGNITTDANGNATVELPAYFETLNRDFRYQLTVVGQFAQAIVSEKIHDNQFSIKTDLPNVEVSWQVTGIRQDPWANENRIQVEERKPADERGTYLYPAGYGQPESRGVHYEEQQRMRQMQETAPPPGGAPGR